jgi:uncharacterized membrane protein
MRQKQTRKQSIIESVTNTAFGTFISFLASLIIYPLVGVDATMKDIGQLTIIFTCLSIVKNFVVRRFFETDTWTKLWRKRKS